MSGTKEGAVTRSCKTLHKEWRTATFKREAALLAMGYYGWLTNKYFSMTDAALVSAFSPAYNTLTMVVVPIIAAAFGADLWAKLREKTAATENGAKP